MTSIILIKLTFAQELIQKASQYFRQYIQSYVLIN